MDIALEKIERIMGVPTGTAVPVHFDFRTYPLSPVYDEFGSVLQEAGAIKLPYSQSIFTWMQRRWDGVDVDNPVPMALFAWDSDDGVISVILISMHHQEPLSGIEWSSAGIRYCEFGDSYKDVPQSECEKHAAYTFRMLRGCLAALATRGVSERVEKPSEKVNAKRAKRCQRALLQRHVIFVDSAAAHLLRSADDGDDMRTSPRAHYRRGHIRRLTDGRVTTVRACIVAGNVATAKRYVVC